MKRLDFIRNCEYVDLKDLLHRMIFTDEYIDKLSSSPEYIDLSTEDALEKWLLEDCETVEKPKKKVRPNRYERKRISHHKLNALYNETKEKYGVGAYFDRYKKRIIRDSVNSKSVRRMCNRRFRKRHNSGIYENVQNGSSYKKYEDYWWNVC